MYIYLDCVGHLFLCIGPILECSFKSSYFIKINLSSLYFIKMNLSSLSLELSAMNNFMIMDGTLDPLFLLNSLLHLVWAWEGVVHVISRRVHMCNFPVIFWVPNKLFPWSNPLFWVFRTFCAFFHYTIPYMQGLWYGHSI